MKNYDQYFSMSLAYLDLGAVAAAKENHWDMYQQALAYQMFHASELFLKFAILSKTQEDSIKEHSISRLLSWYEELYPEAEFALDLPFDFRQNPGQSKAERALVQSHVEQFNPKFLDQHLRYPANQNTGGYSFHFDSSYFESVKARFEEVGGRILASC